MGSITITEARWKELAHWVGEFVGTDDPGLIIASNDLMYPARDVVVLVCKQLDYRPDKLRLDAQILSSLTFKNNLWYLHQTSSGPQSLVYSFDHGDVFVRILTTVNSDIKVDFKNSYDPSCSLVPMAIKIEYVAQGHLPMLSPIMQVTLTDDHLPIIPPKEDWYQIFLRQKSRQAIAALKQRRYR